jgi:hypothetical protein
MVAERSENVCKSIHKWNEARERSYMAFGWLSYKYRNSAFYSKREKNTGNSKFYAE